MDWTGPVMVSGRLVLTSTDGRMVVVLGVGRFGASRTTSSPRLTVTGRSSRATWSTFSTTTASSSRFADVRRRRRAHDLLRRHRGASQRRQSRRCSNRLVGKRLALVDDRPGVTRDRREGEARLGPAQLHRHRHRRLDDPEARSWDAAIQAQTPARSSSPTSCSSSSTPALASPPRPRHRGPAAPRAEAVVPSQQMRGPRRPLRARRGLRPGPGRAHRALGGA